MKHQDLANIGLLAILILVCAGASQAAGPAGPWASPLDLVASADARTLYVAESGAGRVSLIDLVDGRVAGSIDVGGRPSALVLADDGRRLYVADASPQGRVIEVDLAGMKIARRIEAGHTPVALALSPGGDVLYVCERFENRIAVIDLARGKAAAHIAVQREPVAAALTPDGRWLLVANHLPAGRADGDFVAASVQVIDTARREVAATIELVNGSSGVRGLALSPDGRYAYVTHILGHFQVPTTQLLRGWMNTNALGVIDVEAQKLAATVLLDDIERGAANPWGVTCGGDGRLLAVAHAGTHEVSLIDRVKLHEKLAQRAADPFGLPVVEDLTFLTGLRRRVALEGKGPRGLALAGNRLLAAEFFSDGVSQIGLATDDPVAAPVHLRRLPLGDALPMDIVRRGELLFNDATLCFQQWQSCASCHPDSRSDSLNWDLLNDGIGNPKNSRTMLLAHQTPPVMSMGVRDKAETAVRAGIKFIQFTVRPEEDARAIDEYLKSMRPVPSPYLASRWLGGDGLSKAARRGRELFFSPETGCGDCHSGPLLTNLTLYDVGTGNAMDSGAEFDTPSLVECWRTAPYLHDGSAATVMDVLTTRNPGDRHGHTSGLSEAQLADLAEFVLSQ